MSGVKSNSWTEVVCWCGKSCTTLLKQSWNLRKKKGSQRSQPFVVGGAMPVQKTVSFFLEVTSDTPPQLFSPIACRWDTIWRVHLHFPYLLGVNAFVCKESIGWVLHECPSPYNDKGFNAPFVQWLPENPHTFVAHVLMVLASREPISSMSE